MDISPEGLPDRGHGQWSASERGPRAIEAIEAWLAYRGGRRRRPTGCRRRSGRRGWWVSPLPGDGGGSTNSRCALPFGRGRCVGESVTTRPREWKRRIANHRSGAIRGAGERATGAAGMFWPRTRPDRARLRQPSESHTGCATAACPQGAGLSGASHPTFFVARLADLRIKGVHRGSRWRFAFRDVHPAPVAAQHDDLCRFRGGDARFVQMPCGAVDPSRGPREVVAGLVDQR